MSSCLNALSAVTWKDILEPFLGKKTETQKTWITRILGRAVLGFQQYSINAMIKSRKKMGVEGFGPLQNLNFFKLHYKIELPKLFLGTPSPLKTRGKILDPHMINDKEKI